MRREKFLGHAAAPLQLLNGVVAHTSRARTPVLG
jgi:hypothetical protein